LAKPVGSGGEFPSSAAFNKAGTKACVLNGGEINGVAFVNCFLCFLFPSHLICRLSCFYVDKTKGLTPVSHSVRYMHLNQTTPAYGVPGSASQVVFSPDEKKLIVLTKGDKTTEGVIAIWDINADDSLAETPTIMNIGKNVYPFSMTPIPGSNAFVSGDAALGYDIFNLDSFQRKDVKLMTEYPVPGQKGICWSVQSPLTGNYYMTDTFGGKVVEVSISSDLEAKTVTVSSIATGLVAVKPYMFHSNIIRILTMCYLILMSSIRPRPSEFRSRFPINDNSRVLQLPILACRQLYFN